MNIVSVVLSTEDFGKGRGGKGLQMATQSVKTRLTTAAFALFDERGYEHSTVDDIAERAGGRADDVLPGLPFQGRRDLARP